MTAATAITAMNAARHARSGLAYAAYPQRAPAPARSLPQQVWDTLPALWRGGRMASWPPALAEALAAQAQALRGADAPALDAALAEIRLDLARQGLAAVPCGRALALVSALARPTLALDPYPSQQLAAWLLLQGGFAEMATGEGKTLAMGLAAAVAAMAGIPVHVLTANDYLAMRDQALLSPLYARLGLSSAHVLGSTPAGARAALYRRAIVHSTAREIGFDYLRDHRSLQGQRDPRRRRALALAGQAVPTPVLPGLCMALLDEADSLLLDDAVVPLLLAQPGTPLPMDGLRSAYALAGQLTAGRDHHLMPALQRAALLPDGHARVRAHCASDAEARAFGDWVEAALVARHLMQRDRHYVLTPSGVELVDESTGRLAGERRWQGVLYPMVQIKEGLEPAAPTVTAAQITYPRLFQRYLHLGGMSGTLVEARLALRLSHGRDVRRVPLAQPNRHVGQRPRLFATSERRWQAVLSQVRAHAAQGRPVLVGVDSVATAIAVSARLDAAGLAHQRLDARQSGALAQAGEAELIAAAGQAGRVTVATNMAGRGTDIRLDDDARAAGGLHVVATSFQRSRRAQRQLVGRAARHGDPGSSETLLALDDPALARHSPAAWRRLAALVARRGEVPALLAAPLLALAQRSAEAADALRRAQVARGEADIHEMLGFAGASE